MHILVLKMTIFFLKTQKCMLVGYDDETKGYHYYNLNIHTLFISSDVRMNEGYFGHVFAIIVGQPICYVGAYHQ
jgi:hypothetical protein